VRAMILAAGLGMRMRPLTETTPKPMLPIGRKPLLQHHIERLAAAGVRELVINTHWLAEQIETYFGTGETFGVDIEWSRETCCLETGGGVAAALSLLGDEPFILINGDVWTDYPLKTLVEHTLEDTIDAHLVMVENPDHNLQGDFCLSQQMLFLLATTGACERHTFSGLSVLRPRLFETRVLTRLPRVFPLRDILKPAIEQERVTGELYAGLWSDVGTIGRYQSIVAATEV